MIGVPTAPNVTGVEFATRARITACSGLNPRATKSGATSAAGVPNPAAPSTIAPKNQATMITCTLASFDMPLRVDCIALMAPVIFIASSSHIAPRIMSAISNVTAAPLRRAKLRTIGERFQKKKTRMFVIIQTMGIVTSAGFLLITIR